MIGSKSSYFFSPILFNRFKTIFIIIILWSAEYLKFFELVWDLNSY